MGIGATERRGQSLALRGIPGRAVTRLNNQLHLVRGTERMLDETNHASLMKPNGGNGTSVMQPPPALWRRGDGSVTLCDGVWSDYNTEV